jgi:hypothetical protein
MCCDGRFRGLRQAKSDEAQEHDDDERISVVGLSPITLLIHGSPPHPFDHLLRATITRID